MKNKILLLLLFILFQFSAFSQITLSLSACGTSSLGLNGTDSTGRNMYIDGTGNFAINWNATLNQWEMVQLPSTVWYHNTFASTPNPPCDNTGTWVTDVASCGNISSLTGDCQTTLVGMEELSAMQNLVSVYPNPGNGLFQVKGLRAGGTIEVFDLAGRMVWNTVTLPGESAIDLSGKEKGVYLYRIQDKSGVAQGKLTVL